MNSCRPNSANSISTQSFHQSLFGFPNGYDRSETAKHMARPAQPLHPHLQVAVPIHEELPLYESAGMLSEMFSFAAASQTAAATTDVVLDNQISSGYRWAPQKQLQAEAMGGLRQEKQVTGHNFNLSGMDSTNHQFLSINSDRESPNSMQLGLINSLAKPSSPPPPTTTSSLLPYHSTSCPINHGIQSVGLAASGGGVMEAGPVNPPLQFTWVLPEGGGGGSRDAVGESGNKVGRVVMENNRGLSLSLSSSLEAAKFEKLRAGNGGLFFYNQEIGASSNLDGASKNFGGNQQVLHVDQGMPSHHPNLQAHFEMGTSLGIVNGMRNSKYLRPAQELLQDFCCVGKPQFKINARAKKQHNINPNSKQDGVSSSSSKEHPPLSAADKIECQRRKIKLLSMLDEVEGRYRRYCEQMQVVVNSFDSVLGYGAANPYTSLAHKAMSRHFRCIKDAIAAQLKLTCELLGEKDVSPTSGLTKGETPRLRLLEQSFRQQRAFQQMGMMDPDAWRPQRGLPERSINILRAWLFEHFLHPYPSEADKHLLSRQTGLSKNQVSNWFINARVRVWKPMVEDMYQEEAKGDADQEVVAPDEAVSAHSPMPNTTKTTTTSTPPSANKRSHINGTENDPSHPAINSAHCSSGSQSRLQPTTANPAMHGWGFTADSAQYCANMASGLVRHATSSGEVSLTLGLRHADNMPEKSQLPIREFRAC